MKILRACILMISGTGILPAEITPVLSGIFGRGDTMEFCLSAPDTRTTWVKLRDPRGVYYVESFDPKTDEVRIRFRDGTRRVSLRRETRRHAQGDITGISTNPEDIPKNPLNLNVTVYEAKPANAETGEPAREKIIIIGDGAREADDPGLHD